MTKEPLLSDFKTEILKYEDIITEIESIPNSAVVGPLLLSTKNVKLSIISEAKAWKVGMMKPKNFSSISFLFR